MEGGQIVAPFPRDHLERYMKTCKARVSFERTPCMMCHLYVHNYY